jgi:ABC-2 type transport system ATP-binding protein
MISVKNASFSYGKHKVFENVCLELEKGKIYGLLGENGVGKSTLLKVLSGLLKLDGGECMAAGESSFGRTPSFLEKVFYLPEDFAGDNVVVEKYAMQLGMFYPNFSPDKFRRILGEFGVDGKAKFNKLSLGQQKKAIISLALSLGTGVLLMDEPSNGLDIPSKALLRRLIAENASDEQLIIISTHQVKDLENLIDPIIIMDKESVLMNASIEEITRRLTFGIESQEDRDALYCQRDLRGYVTVRRNEYGIETPVDLEALFNCALANKAWFKETFNLNRQ